MVRSEKTDGSQNRRPFPNFARGEGGISTRGWGTKWNRPLGYWRQEAEGILRGLGSGRRAGQARELVHRQAV